MTRDLKKLILSIVLLVQSITMFILFLVQRKERRGLSLAFLGVSVVSGSLGAKLFADASEDDEEEEDLFEVEFDDGEEIDDGALDIDPDELKGDLEHGASGEE